MRLLFLARCRQRLCSTGLVIASAWLVACSGTHEPAQRSPEARRPQTELQPTANVPALIGQSIDRMRRRLGPAQDVTAAFADPAYLADMAPHAADSLVAFRTGGLSLVASYNIYTRQVTTLLLLGHHEDSLMRRAALRAGAANYLVLPAFERSQPGKLLGLRIIPIDQH